jgi:hypothetical protein
VPEDLSRGKVLPARKADNLTATRELIIQKMWDTLHPTTPYTLAACKRDSFTFCNFELCKC